MKMQLLAMSIIAANIQVASAMENYDLLMEQGKEKSFTTNRKSTQQDFNKLRASGLVDNSKSNYVHPVLGTPQLIWASDAIPSFSEQKFMKRVSRSQKRTVDNKQVNIAAGEYYLRHYQPLLMGSYKPHDLKLHSASQTEPGQPIIIRYTQEMNGVPVLGGGAQFLMDKDRKLISVSSQLVSLPPQAQTRAKKADQTFQLSPEKSLALALDDLIQYTPNQTQITMVEQGTQYRVDGDLNGWQMPSNAHIEKLYYPQAKKLIPAYRASVRLSGKGKETIHYGLVFSAVDGTLLQRKDYSHQFSDESNNIKSNTPFSYRVYADPLTGAPQDGPNGNEGSPHPTGKPDGYQAPLAESGIISWSNAGISTHDPWLPENASTTTGNNVDAYLDLNFPDGFSQDDFRPSLSGSYSFDYSFDGNINANQNVEQKSAAVTNLFYTINYLHDVFYDAGFDEAAGNAQQNNFGRGGKEGDRILAEGQDYSGFNNANMFTPPDGQSPIMQQYLFLTFPKLESHFTGIDNLNMTFEGSDFGGRRTYAIDQTSAVLAKNANGGHDFCSPIINTDEIKDKILIGEFTANCSEQDVDNNLKSLDFSVAMIVLFSEEQSSNNANSQPDSVRAFSQLTGSRAAEESTEPTGYNFALASGEDAAQFIEAVKSGNVTAKLEQISDNYRDSTLSNLVVMHEWGHYLHERLAGNGEGLGFLRISRGLAEGYADFVTLLHQVREEDLFKPGGDNYNGAYAQGGWVDGSAIYDDNQAYYFGIRRAPYSVDKSKNNLRYRHLRLGEKLPDHPINGGLTTVTRRSVHQAGEIWAVTLFEAFISLVRDDGRLSLEEARERMRKYLVAGLKLTPSNSDFLMARDAFIAAAYASDKQDARIILQAFANRGMGTKATSFIVGSSSDISLTESESTEPAASARNMTLLDVGKQCDADDTWDQGETAKLTFTIKNTGLDTLRAGKLLITSDDKIEPVEVEHGELGMGQTANLDVEVKINKFDEVAGTLNVFVSPEDTPDAKSGFSFTVNYDLSPSNKEIFGHPHPIPTSGKVFQNWIIERDVHPTPPEQRDSRDTWGYAEDFLTGNELSLIFPLIDNLDESMVTYPFKVSEEPLQFSFKHELHTIEGKAGGLLEIKTQSGEWMPIESSAIEQLDPQGQVIQAGYGGKIADDAGTLMDGRDAFTLSHLGPDEERGLGNVRVNLGNQYANETVQIRFRFVVGTGLQPEEIRNNWFFDDVEFSGVASKVFPRTLAPNAQVCGPN